MKAPRTAKEVQKLNGRTTALGRFVSNSAKRFLPFFKTLRNVKNFEWNEECQNSFDELKKIPKLTASPRSTRGRRNHIRTPKCHQRDSSIGACQRRRGREKMGILYEQGSHGDSSNKLATQESPGKTGNIRKVDQLVHHAGSI
ncbi:uncharacterized protein LOC126656855 [Mercurialis annua]|uniref:uncharacterized protein LOC126656855 n=1 Tax=Mercurialis annua TaxID=3986 RepID=UPI00215EC8F2|nr:uncharacterized protein LOC126656855 [Mercurialis annua]